MKALFGFIMSLALLACSDSNDSFFTPTSTFNVTLSAKQEVPRVDSDASIQVLVRLDENLKQFSASFNAAVITDNTMAHIHQGEVGTNGPVIIPFVKDGDNYAINKMPVTDEQITLFKQGELYINLHSTSHPAGVLRAQILSDDFTLILFGLSGNQEVPSVDTTAKAYGYSTFNSVSKIYNLSVFSMNIDDATAAHIHNGTIGVNGPVIIGLEQDSASGNVWKTPNNTVLTDEYAQKLLNAGLYVNMHTPLFPAGEIRGQVLTRDFHLFTFGLDGEQEVPVNASTAKGDGYGLLKMSDSTLQLRLVNTDVDDATAAHIHTGGIGINGSVLITLEQDASDQGVWIAPADTRLSDMDRNHLVHAGLYANVHTPQFAGGEIRGQILAKYFRLFTFPLSGQQEVPAVTTNASGSGYVLVDTRAKNISQVRVNTQGVANATAGHIHRAARGSNGPVFTPLQQMPTDANIWTNLETVTLDDDSLSAILTENMYVNIHTPANPSGEIRGQIVP